MTSRKYGRLKRRSQAVTNALNAQAETLRSALLATEQELRMERSGRWVAEGLAKDLRADNARMRQLVNDVIKALPTDSIALPPNKRLCELSPREPYRQPVHNNRRMPTLLTEEMSFDTTASAIVDLLVLIGDVDFDKTAHKLHFELEFGDRTIRYAATPSALVDMDPERLCRIATESLVKQFLHELATSPLYSWMPRRGGRYGRRW